MIVAEAVKTRTSDIHLEPEEKDHPSPAPDDGVLKEMPRSTQASSRMP